MPDAVRQRLAAARLYLCADADALDRVLAGALRGGVDVVQLRDKTASEDRLRAAAARAREACREAGALFVVNDRPDVAVEVDADGVHVGQDDAPVAVAREIVGPERLVGVSTHAPADLADAIATGADYAGVGPVHATPTKPGRAAAGIDYVRHAAAHAGDLVWFAIGGLDAGNVEEVLAAGAQRVVVVRAITRAADPEAAARALRAAVEVPSGIA